MAADITFIKKYLPLLGTDLQQAFAQDGVIKEFESGVEILKEGQSVKMIPVVLEGLIKVYTRNEDRELLLYYIEPRESCVMSFLAGIKNNPSKIFAITEKPTTVLLLPSHKVEVWINQFPSLNNLFYDLYNQRYSEMIDSLNQLLFQNWIRDFMNI
jgi:CRP/FNR family transcriptional regulator, anaerobic regulatory protein